jgi:single-stranded-DNA-specific exonuclease
MNPSPRQWKTVKADAARTDALAREMSLPPPVASLLVARGLADAAAASRFLNPRLSDLSDPFLVPGMDAAVQRLVAALRAGERIAVFGDYDADGITATALYVTVLRRLGGRAVAFLPNRVTDGYGLSAATVERCLAAHNPGVLLTADCGTGAGDAVRRAAEAGVDTIVTDHHEPGPGVTSARAVVNPKLGAPPGMGDLAGVGVAFKLCHGLVKRCREEGVGAAADVDLRDWLDWVALGTVADVVPLTGENRILVRHGLARLNATPCVGLRRLIEVAGIKGPLECGHIGFALGPRLNAAGRMASADPALELLLTEDAGRAGALAVELDQANRERKDTEEAIARAAVEEIDSAFDGGRDFAIVVGRDDWHVGTVGIVASRLVQRYGRPAVVVGFDSGTGQGRGSCRSISNLDIVAALGECADLLLGFGGHKMAAGLTMEAAKLDLFRERFGRVCARRLRGLDLRPTQDIDGWIGLGDADTAFVEAVDRLRPFGIGNPTPVWGVEGVTVRGSPRIVGRNHLRMTVAAGGKAMPAIGFGLGERPLPGGAMDLAFELRLNTFGGYCAPELHVRDFRPAEGRGIPTIGASAR